jgi:hypothetical protein
MMTIWRAFYLDEGSAESAERLVVRHRVSLTFSLPGFYREKIRAVPGVVSVVPISWFGGIYKDQKPENFFAQFGTDPEEFFKVFRDKESSSTIPWPRNTAGSWETESFCRAPSIPWISNCMSVAFSLHIQIISRSTSTASMSKRLWLFLKARLGPSAFL